MSETLIEKLMKFEGIEVINSETFILFDTVRLVITEEYWILYYEGEEIHRERLHQNNHDLTVASILKYSERFVIEKRKDSGLPDYLYIAALYNANVFKHRDLVLKHVEKDFCIANKDNWTWMFFTEKPEKVITDMLKNTFKGLYSSKVRGWYFPHQIIEPEKFLIEIDKIHRGEDNG